MSRRPDKEGREHARAMTYHIPHIPFLTQNCRTIALPMSGLTQRTFVNQNIHFHTQALFTAEVNSNSASGMVSVGDSQLAAFTNTGLSVRPARWEGE